VTLARARDRESRQGRHPVARVNERPEKRPGVPSILRRPLPRRCPLGHPALAYPGAMALPPRCRLSTPFAPLGSLAKPAELGSRPRAPLPPGARFSELDVVRRLLQPNSTRGHTLRAVDPRTRARVFTPLQTGTKRYGCVGLMVRCRTGGQRAAIRTAKAFATAFHLHGRSSSRVGAPEQGRARSLDDMRVPFS